MEGRAAAAAAGRWPLNAANIAYPLPVQPIHLSRAAQSNLISPSAQDLACVGASLGVVPLLLPHLASAQDLARVGSSLGVCPYYGSRQLVAEADLLLLPYSAVLSQETRCRAGGGGLYTAYCNTTLSCIPPPSLQGFPAGDPAGLQLLLNKLTPPLPPLHTRTSPPSPPIGCRDSLGVVLAGNAVIFDEAHNLVDAVNGAHSCSVTLSQLRGAGRCAAGRGEERGDGAHSCSVALSQLRGAGRCVCSRGRMEGGEGGGGGGYLTGAQLLPGATPSTRASKA